MQTAKQGLSLLLRKRKTSFSAEKKMNSYPYIRRSKDYWFRIADLRKIHKRNARFEKPKRADKSCVQKSGKRKLLDPGALGLFVRADAGDDAHVAVPLDGVRKANQLTTSWAAN